MNEGYTIRKMPAQEYKVCHGCKCWMKTIFFSATLLMLFSCNKEMKPIASSEVNSVRASKPNVLFILIDDLGREVPTVDGGQSYSTPNMDNFASSAIQFTKAHSCPLCSPSRVELITGKYNFRNYSAWGYLSPTEKTIGNLMKNAGYATGWFGKHQLNGKLELNGDDVVGLWGFDDYCLHDVFNAGQRKSRYRSPHLYTHGAFLPDSVTRFKYGEDIVSDSLIAFMQRNVDKAQPFFAYYPMLLCHKPFQPTPDDPNYLTWNLAISDSSYYPNMVKYCDKVIGQVLAKINEMGIADNTIIIITSDNGTPHMITSLYKGQPVEGGKGRTTEWGINVPLWVKWAGHTADRIDTALIDFTDFLPTLASIAGSQTNLDGTSFYNNIIGFSGSNREWSYCWFNAKTSDSSDEDNSDSLHFSIWVENTIYKRYDSVAYPDWKESKLLNYSKNWEEPKSTKVVERAEIKAVAKTDSMFIQVLKQMHN